MKRLSIDLETYSDIDIQSSGAYKYVTSNKFEILLFSYSWDGGDVTCIDLASGETVPEAIVYSLVDETVIKEAHNAPFERVALSVWLHRTHPDVLTEEFLPPEQWEDTMVMSAYNGYPLKLAQVGEALGLDKKKMSEGKDLIRYFCVPCKPTKANGGRTRNLPCHAPEKWELFKKYNIRDVEVENQIRDKLIYEVPKSVWEEWYLDQRINDRGILIDKELVDNALRFDELAKAEYTERLKDITKLPNPNSVVQLKTWIEGYGHKVESLDKAHVDALLKETTGEVREALVLRQESAKSSVKKYTAMKNARCEDGRAHGMFQFYGANRTGRWAGRLIQLQNLPQNHMSDLDECRQTVRDGDFDTFNMLYSPVPTSLSELVRTALVAPEGTRFIVADFSAIEARTLSWLADEKWRLEAFASGEDIYCASASKMFKVSVVKHGENGHLRQKGKVAELACGYGGSVGAMLNMGGDKMGLTTDEMSRIVKDWREASPNIVTFWKDVEYASFNAILDGQIAEFSGLRFRTDYGHLIVTLPSGRELFYLDAGETINRFGNPSIRYKGLNDKKQWTYIETFGGKLTENIVQAVSRDILCNSIRNLSDLRIVGHVHDEVIIEAPYELSVDEVCERMAICPEWAKGLPLRADGYETPYYKKD